MGYSPAKRAPVTGGAVLLQRPGADTRPTRLMRQAEEPEQPGVQATVGARGDDAINLWPADASPPQSEHKETEAIKAFALVADRWQLTDQQAASLLGADVDAWQTLRAQVRSPAEHTAVECRSTSLSRDRSESNGAPRPAAAEPEPGRTMDCRTNTAPRLVTLSEDQLARISTFFYMYITLKRVCAEGTADRWVTCENYSPVFEGRTPLAVMIEGGLPKIREARNYISSAMW